MTRKQLIPAIAITVLIAAMFAAMPLWFPQKLAPKDAAQVLRRTPSPWQGVLQLWQVNTWRVGRGGRAALAGLAATRFEKRQVGVYVEITQMDPEGFAQRWAAGERPDVVSFPDSWDGLQGVELLELDAGAPPLAQPFGALLQTNKPEASKALPWMAGAQVVLINNEVGKAVGVEPPITDKSWTTQALLDYAAAAAGGRRKKPAQAIVGTAAAWDPLALAGASLTDLRAKRLIDQDGLTLSIDRARERFSTGSTAVLLGTQWEAGVMERLAARGKVFDYSVLPCPADAPAVLNVQYVAALVSGDEERDGLTMKLAQTFLDLPVQQAVAEAICIPVVELPADKLPKGELEVMICAEAAGAYLPRAFAPRPQALMDTALTGDGQAAGMLRAQYLRGNGGGN